MAKTGFITLSQLALVDILAALPMDYVVRVARLGHERLRKTCSLKWVTDRMIDVNFEAAVYVHWTVPEMRGKFCTDSIIKRMYGRIFVRVELLKFEPYREACVELADKVVGRWMLYMWHPNIFDNWERIQTMSSFIESLKTSHNIIYTALTGFCSRYLGEKSYMPHLVFQYSYDSLQMQNVFYRPLRLNGRHIVDVVRAVWPPSPLNETRTYMPEYICGGMLDTVKQVATLRGVERYHGIWYTEWY